MSISKHQRRFVSEIFKKLSLHGYEPTKKEYSLDEVLISLEEEEQVTVFFKKEEEEASSKGSKGLMFISGLDGVEILADYTDSLNWLIEPIIDQFDS